MIEDRVPMTDEDLSSLVVQEISNTLGASNGTNDTELNRSWEKALDYYYARTRGDEVAGRSRVISTDMADMIEQTLAQIVPAFDKVDLCTFEGPDAKQMRMESDAVNYIVLQKNPGYITFVEAIKDALMLRNGIIKIYVDEYTDISYENHEAVPELMVPEVVGQDGEIVSHDIVQEEVLPMIDEFSGQMISQGTPAIYSLEIKRSTIKKELKIQCVAPEEFAVNQDHNSIFLNDARFVRHTKIVTESELIASGYDPVLVKDLKTFTTATTTDQRARSRDSDENEAQTAHHSNRNIEVHECYYLIDFDGDGIAERRKILQSDNTILENEWFPCVPFASGSPYIMPHRFWGVSFYDKLKQTQDIKTGFLRKTLDNAEGLINQRVIANPKFTNMDDLLTSRPTGVVRSKDPSSVVPFPVQNLGDTGFTMLSYMDKMRKEQAGAQLDLGTAENTPIATQSAHGMERWMTSKEHLSFMFVRSFAETMVKGTYLITHKLMKRYMPETMSYQSQGQEMQTSPAQWQYGDKPRIEVETSSAEKQKEYQALDAVLQQQIQAVEKGTSLAQEQNIFNTVIKQAQVAGLTNVTDYWIDPSSQEGQQIAQFNQQESEKNKAEAQAQEDKLYQTQLQISQMQESSDHIKVQMDFVIKENEQLRKWVELELETKYNVPDQGLKSVPNG